PGVADERRVRRAHGLAGVRPHVDALLQEHRARLAVGDVLAERDLDLAVHRQLEVPAPTAETAETRGRRRRLRELLEERLARVLELPHQAVVARALATERR